MATSRTRRHFSQIFLAGLLLGIGQWAGADSLQRPRAGPLDLFETGLYWLQDQTRGGALRDPASLLGEMQDLASRHFDFAEMARRAGGIHYLRLGLLARSHYQNRIRDRLFAALASEGGLYDGLLPRYALLRPVRLGPTRWMAGAWVIRRGHAPRALYFHFAYGAQGWRIVDVSLNGELFTEHLRRHPS